MSHLEPAYTKAVMHPLTSTATILEQSRLGVKLVLQKEPNMLEAADLFGHIGLESQLSRLQNQFATSDPNVLCMAAFATYVLPITALATAAFLLENRVLELPFRSLAIATAQHGTPHGTASVYIQGATFYCLATDAAAQMYGAKILEQHSQLQSKFSEQIQNHFTPIIQNLTQRSSLNTRTIWAIIADSIITSVLRIGTTQGWHPDDTERIAKALVSSAPLLGRSSVMKLEPHGQTALFLERGACCLRYRTNNNEKCLTCPLESRDKRIAKILTSFERNPQPVRA